MRISSIDVNSVCSGWIVWKSEIMFDYKDLKKKPLLFKIQGYYGLERNRAFMRSIIVQFLIYIWAWKVLSTPSFLTFVMPNRSWLSYISTLLVSLIKPVLYLSIVFVKHNHEYVFTLFASKELCFTARRSEFQLFYLSESYYNYDICLFSISMNFCITHIEKSSIAREGTQI
jgi:hypothetical protein